MREDFKFFLGWLVVLAIGLLLDIREFLIWAAVANPIFSFLKQKK